MRKDQHIPEQESTIFAEHKSSVEIEQENKARKEAEKQARAAAKQAAKAEKAARKAGGEGGVDKDTRTLVIALIVLGVVIVGGIVLMIVNQTKGYAKEDAGGAHFYSDEEPELSEEGIKGVITEAYFTNDGSLALLLTLSNGLEEDHYLKSLEVIVQNEDDEKVATGYTDDIPDGYFVKPMGYNTFMFYIDKQYVQLPEDDLDNLYYEINTTGEVATPLS